MQERNDMRILIVSDGADFRQEIEEMIRWLISDEIAVIGAVSSDEACDALAREPVDVMLLDLGLPESSGLETVEALREEIERTPTIVLTGLQDEQIAEEAIRRGAQDYIVKGEVEPNSLRRALRYAVERKRSERERQRALAMFEAVIENTPMVAVEGFDPEGTIRHWNSAAEQLYGYSADEVVGRKLQELLLPPEVIEAFERVLAKIVTDRRSSTPAEWEVRTKGGDRRTVFSTMFPVLRADSVDEIFCMDIDITERKQSERAVENALELQRASTEISSHFAGAVDFDEATNFALERIGRLRRASRVALFLVDERRGTISNTHEWCDADISSYRVQLQNIALEEIGWWMGQLGSNAVIHIDDLAQLPPEARREREILMRREFHSLIVVPVIVEERLIGFVGFDEIDRGESWGAEDINTLTILAAMVGTAYERFSSERALGESAQQLAHIVGALDERNQMMMSMLEDVENARREVEGEREKLETAIAAMEDAIFLLDASGDVLLTNDVARGLFGVPEGHPIGQAEMRSRLWFPLEELRSRVLAGGQPWETDIVLREEPLAVQHLTATPIGAEGRGGAQVTLHDISRERELNRAKDELITTVSHELRTPLTMIKLFLSNAQAGVMGEMGEKMRTGIDRAESSANRLGTLIQGLLDYSRLERGVVRLSVREASMQQIVDEVIDTYDPMLTERKRRFETRIDISDPAFRGDPEKVHQVLANLLDNATKFTHGGGRITLTVNDEEEHFVVSVADDGVGIPPEHQADIFDRFTQYGRTYGPGTKGLGLGLSLCKGIVEKHGGRIWVESTPGEGSTFTFLLPRDGAEESTSEDITPSDDLSMT